MPKLRSLLNNVLAFFPSRLPLGAVEFQEWMDSIVELAGPLADKRSMEFVITSTLLHADIKSGGYIAKRYFVTRLYRSAATQLAHYKFQEIKLAQAEEQEAKKKELELLAQNKVADTASQAGVAQNGQEIPN